MRETALEVDDAFGWRGENGFAVHGGPLGCFGLHESLRSDNFVVGLRRNAFSDLGLSCGLGAVKLKVTPLGKSFDGPNEPDAGEPERKQRFGVRGSHVQFDDYRIDHGDACQSDNPFGSRIAHQLVVDPESPLTTCGGAQARIALLVGLNHSVWRYNPVQRRADQPGRSAGLCITSTREEKRSGVEVSGRSRVGEFALAAAN